MLSYLKLKLKNPFVIAVAIFALAALITAFVGVNPTQSIWSNFERGDGAFQFIHYAFFFILLVFLFPDKKSFERVLLTQIFVSIPISLYALAQAVVDSQNSFFIAISSRVSGTLGNPSYLAVYLLINALIITYFLISYRKEIIERFTLFLLIIPGVASLITILCAFGPKVAGVNEAVGNFLGQFLIWYVVAVGALFGLSRIISKQIFQTAILAITLVFELYILLKTGTRGVFLALLLGLIVLCVINLIINKNRNIRLLLVAGLIVLVGLPALFFATHNASTWKDVPVFNRLIDFESAKKDIQPRIWTWSSALSGVSERPITGWGQENFPYTFDKYYNPGHYGIESFFDRTHNIFLEYLISGGIILFLPWISIFVIYYLRLRRRPKNFWYSILFIMPIMYLIQGFFLFDTLPIFIVLFLFLALFIINEEGQHTLPALNETKLPSALQAIACLAVAGVIGTSLYFTTYLPAKKNLLLVNAIILQNTLIDAINQGRQSADASPESVVAAFEKAYELPSPVGQEETVGMYQKFVIFLVDAIAPSQETVNNPGVAAAVRTFVDKANAWYDNNKDSFPGIKEEYLNAGLNIRFGMVFRQPDLYQRGKELLAAAFTTSPSRLEVIRVMIEVAKLEKNTAVYESLIKAAQELRPDLSWQ